MNREQATEGRLAVQLETERRMGARQQQIIEELRAALREHHADIGVLVHDSTPCSICNVDA